jgi:hypothetical protein
VQFSSFSGDLSGQYNITAQSKYFRTVTKQIEELKKTGMVYDASSDIVSASTGGTSFVLEVKINEGIFLGDGTASTTQPAASPEPQAAIPDDNILQ